MSMRLICALFVFSSVSCGGRTLEPIEPPPPPPVAGGAARETAGQGYSGPMASPEARAVLGDLVGRSFTDQDGVLGGGEWTVDGYSISPYPGETWKRGPHVSLRQGGTSRALPIEADGDVADLYRRVTGTAHATLDSGMSAAYTAAIGKAGE